MEKQTYSFQAEVKQMLHLVTHALYSNKEIFLRELISNASDALDKLRFLALSDDKLYEGNPELKIWVEFDKNAKTITVRDSGIGMNWNEVVENLGTIAKSGTQAFLKNLQESQKENDTKLIGQFGVGFYSAFIVANKVTVKTRRAGDAATEGVLWESDGEGEYEISRIVKDSRGTEIILHVREEEMEFVDEYRLKGIISKYSDHILFPIVMFHEEVKKEEGKEDTKEIKEEVVNSAKALWTLPKKDIKDEEYKELYKHITHDFADPLIWTHNKVEGRLEYTTLLYIPQNKPFDIFEREQKHGLQLYTQHVFIMDEVDKLLPMYLRFVKGIVDSNDLPLNVSREILQSNRLIDTMKNQITVRILELLDKLATDDKEKYEKFWHEFGQIIKEGIAEDYANRDRITKLLRFTTSFSKDEKELRTLDDYVVSMKEKQDKIYYITADSYISAKHSPQLEIFTKNNIEVLLLSDRIDEWLVAHLNEYKGKKLQSITRGDFDPNLILGDEEKKDETPEKQEEEKKETESLKNVIKEAKEVLKDKVEDVRLSKRLTDSPSCLIASDMALGGHLQRLLKQAGQFVPDAKPILELNGEHPLVKQLETESDDEVFAKWVNILFQQALLAEGGQLDDPATFVKNLNEMLLKK